ncbi:RNA polymerase sigma factor [Flavobacteriaceae bacterium GF1]
MSPKNNSQLKISAFFAEEYHALKGYVTSKIDDTADRDAEDILQDVALRIFSRPESALPINNIPGFVYSAIKNRIIDTMRTKKEKRYEESDLDHLWTEFADLFYGTEDFPYPTHVINKLKTAIMELKPPYRDIILAVDFEGYSYKEISAETGIPEGTLMSRRHRAMSLLLKKLEHNITS